MHIAIFYQFYHNPDNALMGRHYTLLQHWARRHEITLLTSRLWYDQRLTDLYEWVPPGVRVEMVDVPYDNVMGARKRLSAFAKYAAWTFAKGLRIPKPDVIWATSPPLSVAYVADRVAALRGVPWIFDVQDLWPAFPIEMGAIRSPRLQRSLETLERKLYHRAAHVVTLSPDHAAHVRRLGVPEDRVSMFYIGTEMAMLDAFPDAEVAALCAAHGLTGKRVILYGGSFGRANALPTLLDAARQLAHRDDVRFVFIGQGYHHDDIAEAARAHGHIVLLPPQPRHQMIGWFKAADLGLASFIDLPVLATQAPSKLFDNLSAGTPVIVTMPGWAKGFVEAHGCGWYVPPEDADALAATLTRVLDDPAALAEASRRATTVARVTFDRDVLAGQMEAVLHTAAAR